MYIHKPMFSGLSGKWSVKITDSRSPISPVIEVMEFTSREAAWQAYRQAMKENGRGN